MTHEQHALTVSPALRPWISGISVGTAGAGEGPQTVIDAPDHATTLALRVIPGRGSDLVVLGPRTRALYHPGAPGPFCVMARIQTGRAGTLLGWPMREMAGRIVPLSAVWGGPGQRLARALADASSDPAAINGHWLAGPLEEALLGRLPGRRPPGLSRADLVRQAAALLSTRASSAAEQVQTTARLLNLSERHLRDLFADAVGVTPKLFARLDRVRAVLARPRQHRAQLAAEAGYYDQSHMTAEFRQIMGVPPGAFSAGRYPAPSPCHQAP